MEENKKIKQELCDMLFDVQQKLSDAEYKDLVETLAKIEDRPIHMMPTAPPIHMMPTVQPTTPPIHMMPTVQPTAPPIHMMPTVQPTAPPIDERTSILDRIKNMWKKPCTFPKCTNEYDSIYGRPYCIQHSNPNIKKTSEQRCGYFNLEKVQCLHKAKVGQNYCSHHINNHTPKPAKKIVTENY